MVVNIYLFHSAVEIHFCSSQAVGRSIQGEKHIKAFLLTVFAVNFFHTADAAENISRFFQENMKVRIGPYLFQIKVKAHTGTDTVSVRTDMSADPYPFCLFTFFQKLHIRPPCCQTCARRKHLPAYSSPASSSVSACVPALPITSSILWDMFTP
jgi:hypothetical protein